MTFKNILSRTLVAILFSRGHMDNFGTRHYEEHFCEICLNLD